MFFTEESREAIAAHGPLMNSKEYYLEYVHEIPGFKHLGYVSKQMAMQMIQESPYRLFLNWYHIPSPLRNDGEVPHQLMNKGAGRAYKEIRMHYVPS
jgi:hypothetical protein